MTRARGTSGVARAMALLLAAVVGSTAHAADVTVELLRLGVGNHARAGDPTAILVRLTSSVPEPVQTRVQWELRNADGDTALYARDVPLAPGAPAERWLYGVLPMQGASVIGALEAISVVRVLQVNEGRVVRELAAARIDGSSAIEPPTGVEVSDALIGVIGDGRAGLAPFGPAPGANMRDGVPSMNETTVVARGIDASSLPDRWEGYASYQALVWSNAPVQNLSPDQARALVEWVRRGGTLVILLPESGDPWGLLAGKGGRTALASVLPTGGVARRDGVPVRELLPLLSRTRDLRNEGARTGVWTFDPAGAGGGYEALMALPCPMDPRTGNLVPEGGTLQGAVVAVRRSLGFGTLAVVGIDADGLERRQLTQDGLPQADVFWNRLLGRRADAPSARQWIAIEAEKRLEPAPWTLDLRGGQLMQSQIGMIGQVAIGILGLIVAFGVYWVAAGPGVYYVLKGLRRVQFAWLGFVGVAVAATALAWLVSGMRELGSGRVRHITYLDRVEAPGATAEERAVVRAQTWFSAELPGYGATRMSLERGAGAAGSDAIWTWFAPPTGESPGYPDTEQYIVPFASPADYTVPSRATSAVFHAAWMGDPIGEWDRLPTADRAAPVRQDVAWTGGSVPTVIVHGHLVHNLPRALTNVHLIYVSPWRSPPRVVRAGDPLAITPSDMMPNYGRMRTRASWEPGTVLDIASELFGDTSRATEGAGGTQGATRAPVAVVANSSVDGIAQALRTRYYERARPAYPNMYPDPFDATDRLTYLNFYSMLQPPAYLLPAGAKTSTAPGFQTDRTAVRIMRDLGRGVDLATWFTRPCLIVIGTLDDDDARSISAPFPLRIDEREPDAEGRTIVRVVFPLPELPAAVAPPLTDATP